MEDNLLTRNNENADKRKIFKLFGIHINETGKELIIGDVVFYILGQIIILIFTKHKIYNSIGYAYGVLLSIAMVVHMTISVEQAMSFGERQADKHIKKTTLIRLMACMVALVVFAALATECIFGMLVGIMALKVSAYLQPFTHKVLARKSKGEGR
jgi:accessory gene regulator protein AgrB